MTNFQKAIAEMYILLDNIRANPRKYLTNPGGACGQDQYAGLPPINRCVDEIDSKFKIEIHMALEAKRTEESRKIK